MVEEQILQDAQAIQNYGAGIIALAIIFGLVVLMFVKIVPILNNVGKGIIDSVNSLKKVIEAFTKTVDTMQQTNIMELRDLKYSVLSSVGDMKTLLSHHCDAGERLEEKLEKNTVMLTEVKTILRNNDQINRPTKTRTGSTDQ